MKDPYEAVLTDLRNKRRQIEAAIVALEAIQRGQEAPSARSQSVVRAPRLDKTARHLNAAWETARTDTLPIAEAAVRILQQHGRPMSNDELVVAVQDFGIVMQSKDNRNTMGALIRRRADQVGDVVKASRGMWALSEWSSEGGDTPIEGQADAGTGPPIAGNLGADVTVADQTHKHV